MLRYSLIHHDVREKFGLTVAEYMVCDSISKLSRTTSNRTTHRSNVEIAKFIGFNEITVRRAKISLLEKGLIFEMLQGYGATHEWEEAVNFIEPRQNVEPESTKCRDSIINTNNKNKKGEIEISPSLSNTPQNVEVIPDTPKLPAAPRDKTALSAREICYSIIKTEYGQRPTPTMADYYRIKAAFKAGLKIDDVTQMMEDAIMLGKGRTVRGVFTDREIDIYKQENL